MSRLIIRAERSEKYKIDSKLITKDCYLCDDGCYTPYTEFKDFQECETVIVNFAKKIPLKEKKLWKIEIILLNENNGLEIEAMPWKI